MKSVYLNIPSLNQFMHECKEKDIAEIRLLDIIDVSYSQLGIPFGKFVIILTANYKNSVILKYEEKVVSGIIFDENTKEKLLKKLKERVAEIVKELKDKGFEVRLGQYSFE